jgi:hypothetical protein
MAWQVATGYGQRALIETTMGRYKALIGPRLRARGFAAQQTEAAIGVAVLNRMLAAGRPKSFVAGASSHDEPGLGPSGTLPDERTNAESQATAIWLSLQPSPASETSAFSINCCAKRLPVRINVLSRSRSSVLSSTMYFFTAISFAATNRLRHCIAETSIRRFTALSMTD